MAIRKATIVTLFTEEQKNQITALESKIGKHLQEYYVEGKKIQIKPDVHPDDRVKAEIIRIYKVAGWNIKFEFEEFQRSGNWYFTLR